VKKALIAAVLLVTLAAQSASAAPKVQDAALSHTDTEVTAVVRVVGVGNADQLHVEVYTDLDCGGGTGMSFGLGATVTASGGAQTVVLSGSPVLLGCEHVVSATLASVEVD
jgi:hypothetical protein